MERTRISLRHSGAPDIEHDYLRRSLMREHGLSFSEAETAIDTLVSQGLITPFTVWRCPAGDGWPAPAAAYRVAAS